MELLAKMWRGIAGAAKWVTRWLVQYQARCEGHTVIVEDDGRWRIADESESRRDEVSAYQFDPLAPVEAPQEHNLWGTMPDHSIAVHDYSGHDSWNGFDGSTGAAGGTP